MSESLQVLRRTPLFERHVAAGGRMVDFAGFEMPVRYGSAGEEHLRVRSGVGLFDVSHMGEVRVRGARAGEALDHLLTHRMSDLTPGAARYTLMCTPEGGVVDDLIVYCLSATEYFICTNAGNREIDLAWMREHLAPFDVQVDDEGDAWGQIAVQGPKALGLVARLTGIDVLGQKPFTHRAGSVAGIEGCVVARTGYTGEDGVEIFVPSESLVSLWDRLLEAGEPEGAAPIGLAARDTLRMEARYPLYGHELTRETSPRMASLMWTTKLDKAGGFIGRDAIVARKETDAYRLVGLVLADKRVARPEMQVYTDAAGSEPVGWITSGAISPTLDRSIAIAYVKTELAKPGQAFVVDIRGKQAQAVAIDGAFHKLQSL